MGIRLHGVVLGAAALLLVAAPAGARTRSAMSSRQEAAAVQRLVSAANAHRLPAVQGLFASSAIIQVGPHQWRGGRATGSWWRDQMRHGVRITLRSKVYVSAHTANAVIHRQTRGRDCDRGCDELASWRFAGSRIDRMTLTRRAVAPPSLPTIPSPPAKPPSPHATPTIPS